MYIQFDKAASINKRSIGRRRLSAMQATVVVALVLHVLSGVFWAGSTFALVRMGGNEALRLLRPQLGAAVVAILSGALLWFLLHRGGEGIAERVLGAGAVFAVIAAGVQAATGITGRRALAGAGNLQTAGVEARALTGQRIAAACLAVTVICMAAFRYI
jgi:hypothetical protein